MNNQKEEESTIYLIHKWGAAEYEESRKREAEKERERERGRKN